MIRYSKILVEVRFDTKCQTFLYDKKHDSILQKNYFITFKFKQRVNKEASKHGDIKEIIYGSGYAKILYYNELDLNLEEHSNKFFYIAEAVPEATCTYCAYGKKVMDNCYNCEVKKKDIIKPIKKCKFFKQGDVVTIW
jgi:hypothetical protein